jgi:hypothetical protein
MPFVSCEKPSTPAIDVGKEMLPAAVPATVMSFDRYDENNHSLGVGYLDTKNGDRYDIGGNKIFNAATSTWHCYSQADFREAQEDYGSADVINLVYDTEVEYFWIKNTFTVGFRIYGKDVGYSNVRGCCDSVPSCDDWVEISFYNSSAWEDTFYFDNIHFDNVASTSQVTFLKNYEYTEYKNCSFEPHVIYPEDGIKLYNIGYSRTWLNTCIGIKKAYKIISSSNSWTWFLGDSEPYDAESDCDIWGPLQTEPYRFTVWSWKYDGDQFENISPSFGPPEETEFDRNCDATVSIPITFTEDNESVSSVYVDYGCDYVWQYGGQMSKGPGNIWYAKIDTHYCINNCEFMWRVRVEMCGQGSKVSRLDYSEISQEPILCGTCQK